jgi:hypothetical protein
MNLAVHPVFVCRGSRKSLFALPPTAARRIRNIGSATATLCSLLFTILRLLRLFHIVVAPHCKFKLVPRAISFEFDAGYLTPAPNEEVFDDYDDDALLAQIIVVDDDPLDDETSSESQDASRPSAGRSRQSSHHCSVVRAATQVLNAGTPFGP